MRWSDESMNSKVPQCRRREALASLENSEQALILRRNTVILPLDYLFAASVIHSLDQLVTNGT